MGVGLVEKRLGVEVEDVEEDEGEVARVGVGGVGDE